MRSIIFFCLLFISACKSTEKISLSAQKTIVPLPEVWEVFVKEDFQRFGDSTNLPNRIYIFPPICIDVQGQPYEQFNVEMGIDGERYCVTTNLLAIQLLQKISNLMLQNESIELLSYEDFLQMGEYPDVAALTSYYSESIYPTSEANDSSTQVEMIYFQTELFSLATSIDFEERNLLANQKLFLRYNSNLDWKDILFRGFAYMIKNIGSEAKSIKQLYWSDLEVKSE